METEEQIFCFKPHTAPNLVCPLVKGNTFLSINTGNLKKRREGDQINFLFATILLLFSKNYLDLT